MKLFKKAKKGFTLVELVVVIAVIAILAAVSVGAYFGVTDSANRSKLEQEAKQAYTNIQLVSLVDSKDGFDLDIDGLSIDKLDDFEREVAKAGGDYDLRDSDESINENKPTVIFSETAVQAENTAKTYKQFDYYIPTISGMHANCNLLNGGKITIVKGDNPVFGEGSNTPVVNDEPEHEHEFINGKCSCGEEDPNYEPPHEHTFVKGECTGCGEPDPDYRNPITGLSINGDEEITLTLHTSNVIYSIETTLSYQDSDVATTDTNYTISYASENNDVATVDGNGLVTARGTGSTDITATAKVGDETRASDTIKVVVTKVDVSVSFAEDTRTSFFIGEDETYKFEASASGTNLSDTSVTWSAEGIEIEEDGTVRFGSDPFESAKIKATSVADPTKYIEKTIRLDKKASEINLSESSATLNVNDEYDFADKVSFGNATINKEYRITSSNTNVVTVNGTKIKAVAYSPTPVTITVALNINSNINKTFTVNINNPITSVKITDGTNELNNLILINSNNPEEALKTITAEVSTTYTGVAYTWTVEGGAVAISNETTKNVTLEAKAVGTSKVTVNVSLYGYTSSKTIDVVVNAPQIESNIKTAEIKFSYSDTSHSGDTLDNLTELKTVTTIGFDFIESVSSISKVFMGNSSGIRLATGSAEGKITINLKKTAIDVTVTYTQYDDGASLSLNGGAITSATKKSNINSSSLTFVAKSDNRVNISSILFTYEDDSTGGSTDTPSEEKNVIYTVSSKTAVTASGSSSGLTATFKNTGTNNNDQATKGNSLTLTVSGLNGKKVTKIVLNMKSNSSGGAGTFTAKAGATTISSISSSNFNSSNWYGSWPTTYVDVIPTISNSNYVIQTGEILELQIVASANSLYCKSFTIYYA